MATISNTPRPGYVWDSTDNVWYPIGVGAHQHTNAADTPAVIPNALVDAKGDLLTATADNTPARLAVGSNDQVLTADSSTATGLKWAAPSSGSYTLISTTTLAATASTITFDSIASTYQNLQIVYNATGADDYITMTFNNVTTSTHYSQFSSLSGTTFTGTEFLGSAGMYVGVKNDIGSGIITIPNYKATTLKKTAFTQSGRRSGTGSNGTRLYSSFATNDATTAISRIDLSSASVFGIGSSFSLYGVS